jgi:hypothetical protein
MPKRKRTETDAVRERRLKEGKGQGEGKNYEPYLTIHDVASQGRSHRIKGWKTGRVHHLFSDGELYCFYFFEWLLRIIDILEQFPLDFELTQEIAEHYQLRHPVDPITRKPKVMTQDFRLKLTASYGYEYEMISFKYRSHLDGEDYERLLHEHEIQRLYCKLKGWKWAILTDEQLPMTLIKNVQEIHGTRLSIARFGLSLDILDRIDMWLQPKVAQRNVPLAVLASECDQALNFTKPLSLRAVKYFIATRRWLIDMNAPFETGLPLNFMGSGS